MRLHLTSGDHPSANGQVERLNMQYSRAVPTYPLQLRARQLVKGLTVS